MTTPLALAHILKPAGAAERAGVALRKERIYKRGGDGRSYASVFLQGLRECLLSQPRFFGSLGWTPKVKPFHFWGLLEDEEGRLGIAHFYTAIAPSKENRENLSRYVFVMIFSP